MQLTSPAFSNGEPIPKEHTEDGNNVSPPLHWTEVPAKAQSFALVVEDPDAPRSEPWVHWVIYDIPGEARDLPPGVPRAEEPDTPRGAGQGLNSWPSNNVGYRGPAPPKGHGRHRYYFTLYALDRPLNLAGRVEKDALQHAMDKAKVLAEAELMGTYER
jgi:hypothetical protein